MNAHERCLLLVAARVDFELERDERRDMDRHLATCATCPGQASLIVADAARIADLPVPQRRPVSAGRPAARTTVGRPAMTSLRLVAMAALLALLAIGALAAGGELIRRLEAPRDLAVAVTPRPTGAALPSGDRSPAAEPSSAPSAAPSAAASAPPCVVAPSVDQLAANGGAWGFAASARPASRSSGTSRSATAPTSALAGSCNGSVVRPARSLRRGPAATLP